MPKIIDVEPVVKKLKGWIKQVEAEYPFSEKGDSEGIECCIAELQDAPTIDPETLRPVAHWIRVNKSQVYICDSCKVWFNLHNRLIEGYRYCPYCGARMEDKKDEGED